MLSLKLSHLISIYIAFQEPTKEPLLRTRTLSVVSTDSSANATPFQSPISDYWSPQSDPPGFSPGARRADARHLELLAVYDIYALVFRVHLPFDGFPGAWALAERLTMRLCKAAGLPYLPLFPHSVEFLANTIRFHIICKDYDSINQHSHQSTRTTGAGGKP